MNIAIIGAGGIARKFCKAAKLIGAHVVAVSSKDLLRAQTFARETDIPLERAYDSYEQMLQSPDIDLVYIATTHNFHYENIKLCLNHGKHVLCEKCMVLTHAQAKEVFDLAKQKNLFLMEAMWTRFLPAVKQAKAWIESGAIGDILFAEFAVGFRAADDPTNRIYNPALAGGAMYDIGVYAIESATFLIDQPLLETHTMITKAATGVDNMDNITMRFESCIANLQCCVSAPFQTHGYVFGTKGYVFLPHFNTASECFLYQDNQLVERYDGSYENGFQYELAHVIACIEQGAIESDVVPASCTLQCAEIFDQALGTV